MEETGGESGYYEEYDGGIGMVTDDSEESGEEEMVEVSDGNQTLYFQSKDGMAQCEFCGKYGVRDAFYSKTKEFCSVACSRSYVIAVKDGKPIPKYTGALPVQIKTTIKPKTVSSKADIFALKPGGTFNWNEYLDKTSATAAPVSCFKHCPMSDSWDNIAVGMKVEIINTEVRLPTTVYWIASVIKLAGFKGQLRYEGYGTDQNHDFWVNLCSRDVHPVGWCAQNTKPLVPPSSIQDKYSDWKDFLVKRLTGARTLPQDFYTHIQEQLQDWPVKKGHRVEVVDKMCVSTMRVATVEELVGGRLKLKYHNTEYEDNTFWCHETSPLLHAVGWSQTVGHRVQASQDYKADTLKKIATGKYDPEDVSPDMLPQPPCEGKSGFQKGMKLETIDPLNLSAICVGTVTKVLRSNYVMVGIDGSIATDGSDWFCYHTSSPCIFPVGFAEVNNLQLTPPRNFKGEFRWLDYLKQTKSAAAPVKLFNREMVNHGFRVGMKLEAADLMDPRLICVGSVTRVVGRLLRVHFDGWDQTYDQWVDCESADIYPAGWSELNLYHLEGPKQKVESGSHVPASISKKRKSKSQIYRGPRKKRKSRTLILKPRLTSQGSIDLSELSQDSFESDTTGITVSASEKTTDVVTTSTLMSTSTAETSINFGTSLALATTTSVETPSLASINQQHLPNTAVPASISSSQESSASSGVFSLVSPQKDKDSEQSSGLRARVVAHNIPRVIPGNPDEDCVGERTVGQDQPVTPRLWSVFDVCQFLRINDCAAHCESFKRKGIDGNTFLDLTKEQIVSLIGMKVGPSLKVYDLIQALKHRSDMNKQTANTNKSL